jgi:DNA-binding transcriptional regulator of glucitol operon
MPMVRLNVMLLWLALCVSLAGNWIQHYYYQDVIKRMATIEQRLNETGDALLNEMRIGPAQEQK